MKEQNLDISMSDENDAIAAAGQVAPKPRAPRKAKPGKVALREIKKLQATDKHVVPRESMRRLIAEIVQGRHAGMCVAADAVEALRVAAEAALTQTFGLAGALATDLQKKDTVDLASFRAAANILTSEHLFSTAGAASGSLTAPL
jgi:histone H3/H4